MSRTSTASIGTEYQEWLGKLEFYKNEIGLLNQRLLEVAAKNSGQQARAGMEHFQNQFVLQRTNIDELRHRLNEGKHQAFEDVQEHAGHVSKEHLNSYRKTLEDLAVAEKLINELRQEFNEYLSRWM